jgi:hypothetical protein
MFTHRDRIRVRPYWTGGKTLVSVTTAGRELILNTGPIPETWLKAAVEQTVTSSESRTL